jgi:RHS repeat-associated protein
MTANSNASYTFDANGNTLTKVVGSNTTSYAWDYENRLTSVTLPSSGGTVTFKYDPFRRRIYKQSPNATSIFVYDGDDLIQTVNTSATTVARYAQGPNLDEPLAMERGTTTDYYLADGVGSITSLTASNGAVAQSYTYDSYGNLTNSSGSLTNFFRYTGREFDTESDLYFYRSRYYDPILGRLLNEDFLGFQGGINFYDYVENQPTDLVDPSSEWPDGWPTNNWWWQFGPVPQLPLPGQNGTLHCTIPSECNFTPNMQQALTCFQNCLGNQVNITCGNGEHDASDPHMKGLAVDISLNANPWLSRGNAERCFSNCFPQGQGGSYAQQEENSNPKTGTHFHIQYPPGRGGAHGFAPGIKKHGKSNSGVPQCKTCGK